MSFSESDSETELDKQYDDVEVLVSDLMHKKHIETLKFLREVLNENKELRDRMRLLENERPECLQEESEDNSASLKEYKEELKVKAYCKETIDQETQTYESVAHYEELHRQWNQKKIEYEKELERVDIENEQLKSQNDELVESYETLKNNFNFLNENLNKQTHKILELQNHIEELLQFNQEIPFLKQINIELEEKIKKLENDLNEKFLLIKELEEVKEKLNEDQIQIHNHFNEEIEKHKETLNNHLNCAVTISDLESKIDSQKNENHSLMLDINNLNDYISRLNDEINSLKEKLTYQENNVNFKEFIMLKRELNALKQASIGSPNVSIHKNSASPASSPLPPLKESILKKKFNQQLKNSN